MTGARSYRHALVPPAGPGTTLVTVRHGLGAEGVDVYCYNAAGHPMGMEYAVAVDVGEVEVAVLPGCSVILVTRADTT